MIEQSTDPWQNIRKIHFEYADVYRIFGSVMLVLLGIWLGSYLFSVDGPLYSEDGYRTNLYTEFISIAITVFILDFLNRRRDEHRRLAESKSQLLRDIRNPERGIVRNAFHEMKMHAWMEGDDSLLKRAYLDCINLDEMDMSNANLTQADLTLASLNNTILDGACLSETILNDADLQNSDLSDANLEKADLTGANLQGACLFCSNLQSADLSGADLENVDFSFAILHGANLENSNTQGSSLSSTLCDEHTILPDGNHWTPSSDLTRFTNPDHPDFWQPEWVRLRDGN